MKSTSTPPHAAAVASTCLLAALFSAAGNAAPYVSNTPVVNGNISASLITIETGVSDQQGGDLSPSLHVTDGVYTVNSSGDIFVNNSALNEEGTNAGAVAAIGEDASLVITAGGDIHMGDGVTSRNGAFAMNGGRLEITAGEGGAIYAVSQDGGAVSTISKGVVVIHSNLYAESSQGRGIYAHTNSTITANGNVTINAGQSGVELRSGGSFTVKGRLDVTSSGTGPGEYAILAVDSSTATLNGGSITSTENRAIFSRNGTIIANAAQYSINGNVHAAEEGIVSLSLNGRSSFIGQTGLQHPNGNPSPGTINLDLQGESLWTVTGNSQLTNLTLGQGSALQLAFSGTSLTDIISATDTITLEAGSYIYLTGDLSGLEGASFDFFDGTLVNNGVKFVGFDGTEWVEYECTQTGANTFAFTANAPTVIEEPGFIPEPATATLGLLGLASLMVRRRRR